MNVIGLNGWSERGHDGGASIIVDGKLLFAIEEEKLIGKRHAYDKLPIESIKACLKETNLSLDDIDKFVFGWDYEKIYRMINKKFLTREEVSRQLFGDPKYSIKFEYADHHLAHGYSAFVPSNFDNALVLVIDGQGEYMGTSIYIGQKYRKLKLIMETPISLGYFYTAITEHIGFKNGEEGKTMGLASYGTPKYKEILEKLIYADDNGKLHCAFQIDKVDKDEEQASLKKWEELLSVIIPRRTGGIKDIDDTIMPYADLAQSAQKLVEEIVSKLVSYYSKIYDIHNVCIAGGVGLNCPTSSHIESMENIDNVFVQPAANDGGISLGCAIKGAIDLGERVDIEMIPYLGKKYSNDEIKEAITKKNYKYEKYDYIPEVIARLLNNNMIVANFQDRIEIGPRALGNRSLLASPKTYDMLVRMNKLKGREIWRPLAPAVLYDKQTEYFDSNVFSPHMTKNFNVLEEQKNSLQAITHIDGTARVQSVTREYNELFYEIINEYYKLSGIPVVINTSFNVKGEPIVCTPEEAINSFEKMNLDYLAMGPYLIKRKK